MATRPRMAGNISARLRLDPATFAKHKTALKLLERVDRKEVIEAALMAGGEIIHAAAEAKAPGKLELVIVGGRSLRKKVDAKLAQIVKANGKFAAIGPSLDKWYYRFFEFGATKHDIKPYKGRAISFKGRDGMVFRGFAKNTGGVRMRPFMRPAVDNQGANAIKALGEVLAREIEKAAKG